MNHAARVVAALFLMASAVDVCAQKNVAPSGKTEQQNSAEPEWRYTIRPGDTLIGLSRQYLTRPNEWPRLQKLNHITQTLRLRPGEALRVPLSMLRQTPAPTDVTAVAGSVNLTTQAGDTRALQVGDKLLAGSRLSAAINSSASLRFADGSVLVLQPASTLQLDTVSVYAGGGMVDTRLRLQEGRAEITANPQHRGGNRLQVTTPSAVAAVRGTRFRVGAAEGITRQETLEGQVGLAAAGSEVAVSGGMGTVAEAGQPPRPPVVLLPAADVSALPSRVERLPMRFELPVMPGAAGWVGHISPDTPFDRVLLEKSAKIPRLIFADLPDGHYVLRVRAEDGAGLQGRDALHAFELDARPFAPLLLSPTQAAVVRSALPELRWSEVSAEGGIAISRYQIELARDAGFGSAVLRETLAQTALKPSTELVPGDYYWRVASVDGNDRGPFSDVVKFTYKPAPGAPDLAQSVLQFERDQMQTNLPPPADGLHYEAELAADPARKNVLWHGESADGKLQMPRPESGKRYLSARMVETDGTAGPFATHAIDVPRAMHWEWLLLLLPLLAL